MSEHPDAREWRDEATLVLLGPLGTQVSDWDPVGMGGVVVEYPGHGTQPRQPGWTHRSVADEVAEAVVGPVDLLGIGTGALVALQLLANHAARVRSAILIGAAGDARLPAAMASAAAESPARAVDGALARWFTPYALRVGHPGIEQARASLLAVEPAAWMDAASLPATATVTDAQLRAVAASVTVVAGTHDRVADVEAGGRLHELIQPSRLELWPAPHAVHLERPEFVRAMLDRHSIWAPVGNRKDDAIASCMWFPGPAERSEHDR